MLTALAIGLAAAPACAFHDERGTIVHSLQPTPQYEASASPELAGERFDYGGTTYVRFGAPRQMAPMELEAFGEKGGVPLFVAAGTLDDSVVYVMVKSAECSFQAYQKE